VDCPQCPTGWRQLGAAGAHRSSALHGYGAPFSVFSLPTEPVECEEPTKGVFYRRGGGGSGARRAAARFKPQTLAMVGNTPRVGSRQVGPNGCDAERRTPTSGRWCSRIVACDVTMKGVNLGFVSIFFEILAQLPPIYKGSELIISCACRDLSLSFQIRLGFDISSDFIEILVGGISVSVATRHEVGDNQH
jgi:hypothetical protein